MRSMASGGAFHVAYYHATQQAFLEAHERAFGYFGGVFRRLRYDNLKSAVKKILRGHQREETERPLEAQQLPNSESAGTVEKDCRAEWFGN
jgi:transposase